MLRLLVLAVACAGLAGALVAVAADSRDWPFLAAAALFVAGTVFERVNYRGARASEASDWRETSERFLDDATGVPTTVWFDPESGARRYVPSGETPPRG